MNICTDILMISTLACRIAECLDDNELALLAADTVLLSDALNAIAVRRAILKQACETQNAIADANNKKGKSITKQVSDKSNKNTVIESENSITSQNKRESDNKTNQTIADSGESTMEQEG